MPVRVGTFTDFRPHNRRIAVALTLSTLMTVILIYLYVTGFCFSTLRYHGDAELVDIAINTNLALHKPGTERDKVYSSLVEFHELNPKCCKVYRTGHWMLSGPGRAATGDVVVNVLYKISDTAQKDKYYDSHVRLSSCGALREMGGTMEQLEPRR